MMRSLFAAMSGLKNHQTRMDVIGNNIANVNTVGFKSSTVNFQDVLSQTLQAASAAQGNRGGTNPMQVGLGMGLASISTDFTDGSPEATGRLTDLAISGSGFFMVSDGTNQLYTRAGNFDFDPNGNFIDISTGYTVYGWQANSSGIINTNTPATPISIGANINMPGLTTTSMEFSENLAADAHIGSTVQGTINVYDSLGVAHKVTTTFTKVGTNTWVYNNTVPDATAGSITNGIGELTFDSTGALQSKKIVDPASITSNTINVSALTLNNTADSKDTQYVTVFDANKNLHTLKITFTYNGLDANSKPNWSYTLTEEGGTGSPVSGTIGTAGPGVTYTGLPTTYDYSGGTASITWPAYTVSSAPTLLTANAAYSPYTTQPNPPDLKFATNNGANPLAVGQDMSALTQYGADGKSTAWIKSQNGYPQGELQKYSINVDGIILGTYSNNQSRSLGQVALANFANPGGLTRTGSSFFMQSANSGEAQIGTSGTGGRGSLLPGNLEMSNVDLAKEFSNMIVTQRGFQANSKIISTTDEMLQELANLKR
ncbi:hypothetical protein SCACP_16180 [Sporomusa carbonis]|uniref:flagellar hook protein FlgE n=1 Tax=Sporomusa carbonis TaxID=3076075 RepID=UPI003A64A2F0